MYTLICEWCKREFQAVKKSTVKSGPRRFCGTSCSAQWRMSQPEYKVHLSEEQRKAQRQRMIELRERPDVQKKLAQHLSSEHNPLRLPENQRKSQIAMREKGYAMLNGGNGKPMPIPQRLLMERLGWPTEYVVTVMPRIEGMPKNLKIDIAEPLLKIAIEVDGQSHKATAVKEKDARKTAYLESQGWRVLRFWNKEILTNSEGVIAQIMNAVRSTTSKPEPAIISPTDSLSTIATA